MKILSILLLVLTASLSGCYSMSAAELANADYGPRLSEEQAANFVRGILKDPYSAQISCGKSGDLWWVYYGQKQTGQYFKCYVNAKNGFGGYTGQKLMHFAYNKKQGVCVLDDKNTSFWACED